MNTRIQTLAIGCFLTVGVIFGMTATQPVEAKSKPGSVATTYPWQNEQAFFKVKVNGAEAVHAVLRVGDVRMANNKPYLPISANAQSVGAFKSIVDVQDRANTFINPMTHRPIRSEKRFKERALTQPVKERIYKVDYKAGQYKAQVKKTIVPKKERTFTKSIPGNTHDAISWLFDLRTIKTFTPGQKINYYIYDGWKLSRLELEVKGKEKILTELGWRKSWKFGVKREILLARSVVKNRKRVEPALSVRKAAVDVGHLWLTDDAQRLPAKLSMVWKVSKALNMVAKVEIDLVRYKRSTTKSLAARPVKQPPRQ